MQVGVIDIYGQVREGYLLDVYMPASGIARLHVRYDEGCTQWVELLDLVQLNVGATLNNTVHA